MLPRSQTNNLGGLVEDRLDDELWFPENYHWGPSPTEERPTQGGGTAVWDHDALGYVFKEVPAWWDGCKPGDPVPEEWGVL